MPSSPLTDETDEVFRALADPTRRRMLDLLAEHGRLSVGELAAHFPSLVDSGISKHLMTLRAAHLVVAERVGRQRIYYVDGAGFARTVGPWLRRYEPVWERPLAALQSIVEREDLESLE